MLAAVNGDDGPVGDAVGLLPSAPPPEKCRRRRQADRSSTVSQPPFPSSRAPKARGTRAGGWVSSRPLSSLSGQKVWIRPSVPSHFKDSVIFVSVRTVVLSLETAYWANWPSRVSRASRAPLSVSARVLRARIARAAPFRALRRCAAAASVLLSLLVNDEPAR